MAVALAPASATAFGPGGGADPASNFSQSPDRGCDGESPDSPSCINAGVRALNASRAHLGQGPYALPSNYTSLPPEVRAFVLTNLDRAVYRLPAVPGLTAGLNADAARGVQADDDPSVSDPSSFGATANWAGAYTNMEFAYQAWMYDDGPGSRNLDCRSPGDDGCWGHRHDVLWNFDQYTMAMGAAQGVDPSGDRGYAMLIAGGDPASFRPAYSTAWAQLVSAGAGTNAYDPGPEPSDDADVGAGGGSSRSLRIRSITVRGRKAYVHLTATRRGRLRCSLQHRGSRRDRYRLCFAPITAYSHLERGTWTVRVRQGGRVVKRRFRVR